MEKFNTANVKGANDTAAGDMATRTRIISVLKKHFEAYGYLPIETANLNYLSLLTYKYAPDAEIVREIYKIRDQGDRDLGLRFDLTVPFCKFIANNQGMKLPFKRYEIGKVWRNGPTKSGRVREFYQCDVDAVGISGVHAEAELISMAVKIYRELGIEPIIKYNSRKLLPADERIIAVIDRIEKEPRAAIIADLKKYGRESAEELYDNLLKTATSADLEILALETELGNLGVLKYCKFTPSLARGLNIYTGIIWEVFDAGGAIPSSLGGGGRYDNIIGNFIDNGQKYPAVGMGFGLEPIVAVLSAKGSAIRVSPIDIMLVPLGTESFCQTKADEWRGAGKRVLVYLGGKSMAKAFEYAAANGIKSVAVVGGDEVAGKEITFKEVK
jgi:histidyl-tRNA synthetase